MLFDYISSIDFTNSRQTRGEPVANSVNARATRPSIANLPFHISASEVITPSDRDSAVTPLNSGTSDAAVSTDAVARNQGSPGPSASCAAKPVPLANSTPSADTNPTMASLPFILSGAGPANASTSENLVLAFFGIVAAAGEGDGCSVCEGFSCIQGAKGTKSAHVRGEKETRGDRDIQITSVLVSIENSPLPGIGRGRSRGGD